MFNKPRLLCNPHTTLILRHRLKSLLFVGLSDYCVPQYDWWINHTVLVWLDQIFLFALIQGLSLPLFQLMYSPFVMMLTHIFILLIFKHSLITMFIKHCLLKQNLRGCLRVILIKKCSIIQDKKTLQIANMVLVVMYSVHCTVQHTPNTIHRLWKSNYFD